MDTAYSPEDLAFRDEVRGFFEEAYTPELRSRMRAEHKDAMEDWQRKLYEKGWVAPNWPAEYGGTGWTATQKYIYETERSLAGHSQCRALWPRYGGQRHHGLWH
jgi:alkylation response protein AidB-like acyl-CoA dehydrogenase